MKKSERTGRGASCAGRSAGFRRGHRSRADHYGHGLDPYRPDSFRAGIVPCITQCPRLLKESVNELLEGAPTSLDIGELKRNLCRSIPEVRNVHHVHVWLVGEKPLMTLHVQVIPPHDHDALLERIRHFLEHHYEIAHATIQMEYQPCNGPDCHLNEAQSGHSHAHHH